MHRLLLFCGTFVVCATAVTAQIDCYKCGPKTVPCRADPFEFPADSVEAVACGNDRSCVTMRTEFWDGSGHFEVERMCSTSKMDDGCTYTEEGSGGNTKVSICACNTPYCNFRTTSATPPIKCYKCDSHDPTFGGAHCMANPLVLGNGVAEVTCRAGQACLTTRTEDASGKVFVRRDCSSGRSNDGCTFHNLPGGVKESRCHYNKAMGNNEVTSVVSPINCFKCGPGNKEAECMKHPFETTGILTDHCAPGQACLITRTKDNTGKETVTRGCSPTTTTPATPCVYSPPTANGVTTSNCYCTTERCNTATTSATEVGPTPPPTPPPTAPPTPPPTHPTEPPKPFVSCYTCKGSAACSANPFVPTATGITVVNCKPGIPCLTVCHEKSDVTTVERRCADDAKTVDTCDYTTPDEAKESKCYCNSDKCNGRHTTATKPSNSGSKAIFSMPVAVIGVLSLIYSSL